MRAMVLLSALMAWLSASGVPPLEKGVKRMKRRWREARVRGGGVGVGVRGGRSGRFLGETGVAAGGAEGGGDVPEPGYCGAQGLG